MSFDILPTAAKLYEKIALEMAFKRRMALKVTQGQRKWRDSIGRISLPVSGL